MPRALSLDEQARRGLAEQTAANEAQGRIAAASASFWTRPTFLILGWRTHQENGPRPRAASRAGLGVFGVALRRVDLRDSGPTSLGLTPEERSEVANGCYELLLILADAVSQSPAADPPAAENALRIVDRATGRACRSHPRLPSAPVGLLDMKGDRDSRSP